jgi:hypothetical protein
MVGNFQGMHIQPDIIKPEKNLDSSQISLP